MCSNFNYQQLHNRRGKTTLNRRKELMVPILTYRIQEKEYGGLSHSAGRDCAILRNPTLPIDSRFLPIRKFMPL
jgi:hypothetical protein